MALKFADRHLKRLRKMTTGMRKEAQKLVYTLADMHATEAALSITSGSVSGKNHKPSSPGQPPNADTGQLDRSVHVEQVGPLQANSVADAPYAAAQEFGSSTLPERPFMRPAAKKVRKQADKLAKAAVDRIVKGGKL
ncbi:HK97 gp10 family phage protein [Sphingobium sp. LMC3-1-1.1]|uniref:HK97-gp10 family putative phage morphogenesis protein n=1 Tax=Sphingobium sp. LMC3-1-1.1 TaxID=3135241 RepID=UPI0034350823